MTGTVQHAKIDNPTSRKRLRSGRGPHWQAIIPGKFHLGYQRWPQEKEGRWVLRRYMGNGKYRIQEIGRADDDREADGLGLLSFEQARDNALAQAQVPKGRSARLTVKEAMTAYIAFKDKEGQPIDNLQGRVRRSTQRTFAAVAQPQIGF
jgi:hypothetical protein